MPTTTTKIIFSLHYQNMLPSLSLSLSLSLSKTSTITEETKRKERKRNVSFKNNPNLPLGNSRRILRPQELQISAHRCRRRRRHQGKQFSKHCLRFSSSFIQGLWGDCEGILDVCGYGKREIFVEEFGWG